MVVKSCRLEDLEANLIRDLGENYYTVFVFLVQRVEAFIKNKDAKIDNSAGAQPGFYDEDHYKEGLEVLARRVGRLRNLPPDQPLDESYLAGDPIYSNFKESGKPDNLYKHLEKRAIYAGGIGEASFIIREKSGDVDATPPADSSQDDKAIILTEEVLSDTKISNTVRAALVYERGWGDDSNSFGHTPWKKFHEACADPRFIAKLLDDAPSDIVTPTESTSE
jgi:hypothetical protein